MRIGILGAGEVGRRLGEGFVRTGHDVKLGTRDPSKTEVQEWVKSNGARASAGTFEDVARSAEVAVLATAWSGAENALRLAGPSNLRGKVVIDVTNPLRHVAPDAPPVLAVGHTDSAGERVQRALPEAKVVKAFNIVGNPLMIDPSPVGRPTMWIAGNDHAAKGVVERLLRDFGWTDVVDLGGIEASRYLEPMAMVWILDGFATGRWSKAFGMLRAASD